MRGNIGAVVKFMPRPKQGDKLVSEGRNKWVILQESEGEEGLIFQNTVTNHEITMRYDSLREFRSPDMIIVRGQVILEEDAKVTFEPFTESPEIDEVEDPQEIVADRHQLAESELVRLSDVE